ncbi:MAG: hypothetical protein ACOYL5_04850 [Phototrophicaceae bacterium]|jgi:tetratricopeptide (TPR) repeat protein
MARIVALLIYALWVAMQAAPQTLTPQAAYALCGSKCRYPAVMQAALSQLYRIEDPQGLAARARLDKYVTALDGRPREQAVGYLGQAQIYALTFDYNHAIESIQTALMLEVEHPPLQALLYTRLGDYTLYLYEWDAALDAYNTAIALDETLPEATLARARLYVIQLDYARAIPDYERYLAGVADTQDTTAVQRELVQAQAVMNALAKP